MKRILTIALVLISIQAFSQNYKLFKPDSRKVYAQLPALDSTFNIKFDSVSFNGIDSVYHFYKDVGDEWINGQGCPFWGSDYCNPQDKPNWLGNSVLFNESYEYKFINLANDTLYLSFPLLQGSSIYFFEDETQRFSITYEGKDTTSILGILDTIKNYRINHFNPVGDTIQSAINNHMIMVGKTLGLIQFFQVDKFPGTLKPLCLIGNISPNIGLYQITDEMVYDFQPGDEVQYYDRYSNVGGPPENNYTRYIKYYFLERIDTTVTIKYKVASEIFYVGSTNMEIDTFYLSYQRNHVIATVPFDYPNQSGFLYTKRLYKKNYCGSYFWTYYIAPQYMTYCELENCWGRYDIPGPPPNKETTYVLGLGLYIRKEGIVYPPPVGYSMYYNVIYFKKNGIECGDEIIVGQIEHKNPEISLNISPNPALSSITITVSENTSGQITFYNLEGQELVHFDMKEQKINIDVTNFKSGVYILKYSGNNFIKTAKFIKQ